MWFGVHIKRCAGYRPALGTCSPLSWSVIADRLRRACPRWVSCPMTAIVAIGAPAVHPRHPRRCVQLRAGLHLQVWRRPQATPRRDLQLRGPSRRLVSAAGVRHCPINSVPKCMELYDTLDRRRNNVPDPLRRFPNLRKGADAETLRRFGNLRKDDASILGKLFCT